MLTTLLGVESVEGTDQSHQSHNRGKYRGQLINPAEFQGPVHKLERRKSASERIITQYCSKREYRNQDQIRLAQRPANKGQQLLTLFFLLLYTEQLKNVDFPDYNLIA